MRFTSHGTYEEKADKVAMIVEGPNEVGNIKLLLSNGEVTWRHCSEVEYMPKERRYFQE
tara:strand:- start:115 stop:291 length:177 start_codon:yes stop_codon:yes gene_type:complete